jgi:hypothetical protein
MARSRKLSAFGAFDIRRFLFSLRYFVLLPTSHQSLLTVVRRP